MSAKRPKAAFTIVQNEPVWLDHWAGYYARQVGAENVFILDHDTPAPGGGFDALARATQAGCHRVPIHRTLSYHHDWLRETVEAFQRFLLQSYEVVAFAEADEFLVADPSIYPGGLPGLLDGMASGEDARPLVRASGFNVVHYKDEEPALRFDQPLLAQRRWWHASAGYSKPSIARCPLRYTNGFHDTDPGAGPSDPGLLLVHLHRIDWGYALLKHQEQAARRWSESDLHAGAGFQNRITDEAQLADWFYRDGDTRENRAEIPSFVRDAISPRPG